MYLSKEKILENDIYGEVDIYRMSFFLKTDFFEESLIKKIIDSEKIIGVSWAYPRDESTLLVELVRVVFITQSHPSEDYLCKGKFYFCSYINHCGEISESSDPDVGETIILEINLQNKNKIIEYLEREKKNFELEKNFLNVVENELENIFFLKSKLISPKPKTYYFEKTLMSFLC